MSPDSGDRLEATLEPLESEENQEASLDEEAVMEFLMSHPDFFEDKVEVLAHLNVPARFGSGNGPKTGVVDFQQVMLEQQREAVKELRECVRDVIETSRANLTIQQRTHAAVLALLGAQDFDQLVHAIVDDLPMLLDLDVVAVGYEPSDNPFSWLISPEINALEEGLVDALLGSGREAKIFPYMEDDGSVFGSASGLVQSAAVARLNPGRGTPAGLMALGSREPTFQQGQGTDLVVFLARVLEICVDRLQVAAKDII